MMIRRIALWAAASIGLAGAAAAQAEQAPATLASKLPEGLVKTVLERLPANQRAALEAASNYEIGLVEHGESSAPPAESTAHQIESLVGARMALLVAANTFEDDRQALDAFEVESSSELRAQAMATEVAKTSIGRRYLGADRLKAIEDLLSGSQMIMKPWNPCGEGAIADSRRLPNCVYRQSYKSVVGIAWPSNGRLEISCSGQLISQRFILTADHCFDNKPGYPTILTHFTNGSAQAVRKGGTEMIAGLREHGVSRVHRGKTTTAGPDLRGFDVALVELNDPVPFSGFPSRAGAFPNPPTMTAAGWGRTDAELVNQVALEVTSISVRGAHNVRAIDPSLRAWPAALKDGGSICAADSGGPIYAGLPGSDIAAMLMVGLVAAGNQNCTSGNQVMTDLTRKETIEFICGLAAGNPYCR